MVEETFFPPINYSYPFGIGVMRTEDGIREILYTFKREENVVNAYGGWYKILNGLGHEVLAFEFAEDGDWIIRDDLALEGLALSDFEMGDLERASQN